MQNKKQLLSQTSFRLRTYGATPNSKYPKTFRADKLISFDVQGEEPEEK